MKIEKKHIAFLEDITHTKFFKVAKPVNDLVEKEPNFLADYMAMIYRRRPIEYNINNLIRDYSFFKPKIPDFQENGENLKELEKLSKRIYRKHFSRDKEQGHFADLFHRLSSTHCPMYDECKGLPNANFGVGGCDGPVWCSVYNLGGSHGSMGDEGNFRKKGYNYLYEVPKDLRLKEMRKLYNKIISYNKMKNKISRRLSKQGAL